MFLKYKLIEGKSFSYLTKSDKLTLNVFTSTRHHLFFVNNI